MYIFLKAIWRCFRPYPHYLILEYGIDHPGEMEYLLSIARPDIAILSPVAPNHLEQFGTLDLYRREKLLLIQRTRSYAIVHESLREYVQEKAFFYGKENSSYAHISHTNQEIDGIDASFLVGKRGQNLALPSF